MKSCRPSLTSSRSIGVAPDTVASASPHAIHARAQGASVIQVESSRLLPWLGICCILSGFAMAFSIFTFYQLTRTEREYELLKIQQQMTNAWLGRAGFVKPSDVYNGPEGNFFYKQEEKTSGRP